MTHNSYLFDKDGEFTADFESMYLGEEAENFDAWNQDEISLYKSIDFFLCGQINVKTAIDLGCGKGCFTEMVSKVIPNVLGVDISPTAIAKARKRYPNLKFCVGDLSRDHEMEIVVDRFGEGRVGLIVARALLYYLPNWKTILTDIARHGRYVLLGVNIPDNTKLYIPSKKEFIKNVEEHFKFIEVIDFSNRDAMTILAESRI